MALSVDRTLTKARTLERHGRIDEARALCDDLLSRFPKNARVRAVRARLTESEIVVDGIEAARSMAEAAPSVDTQIALGRRLTEAGDHTGAAAAFSSAVKLCPDSAAAYSGLGLVFLRQNDPANAALALNRAVALDPALADAWSNLGAAFLDLKRFAAALEAFDTAIGLDPALSQAHNNRGLALREMGRGNEAVACFREAIRRAPQYDAARSNLGSLLRVLGRHEEAIEVLRAATRMHPGFAEGHNNLAAVLGDLGRFDEARAAYAQALRIRPDFAHAHYNLALICRHEPGDSRIAQMRDLLRRTEDTDARLHLNFALGKAADDCGDHETAFRHFAEGNRIRRATAPYDRIRADRLTADIEARSAGAEPLDVDPAPLRPVFIIGMPRSGTTLVEQILASHGSVDGGGEMTYWARFARETMAEPGVPDAGRLMALRQKYLENLGALGFAGPVVTEKLPANYVWTGLIARALPEAAIVDVRRDPRAVAWSIFRTYFSASGNDYAYDLADIAHQFGLYQRTMDSWSARLPQRVHRLSYEALTENQEAVTRALLDSCGLPFEDACLAFHQSRRAVNTASAAQIRKGLYTGSSEKWRAYEPWLDPLMDAFEAEGVSVRP